MSAAPADRFFRFRPPAATWPEAGLWALRHAFADDGASSEDPELDATAAEEWAFRLGLVERIATRRGEARLAVELGEEVAERFVAASRRTVARNLLLRQLAELAVEEAARRGIPVLLLKGMALLESLPGIEAARPLADVDLLTDRSAATELSAALAGTGLTVSPVHESAHHLPALHHPELGTLEIHLFLPGVRLKHGVSATAGEILARGLCGPAPRLDNALVPEPRLLAAHAIAHGVHQGGRSPEAYPLLRLVADLHDLVRVEGVHGSDGIRSDELAGTAVPLLADAVSRREIEAVAELAIALGRGVLPDPSADARRILDHVLVAHLDPGYRRALKVSALAAAVRRGDWLRVRRRASSSLTPGRGHGLASSLSRLIRVGWSWLARRSRRRSTADPL